MTNDNTDTIADETNMADVNVAILVATQSWSMDPLPMAAKSGERHIVWPAHDRDNNAEEYSIGSGGCW